MICLHSILPCLSPAKMRQSFVLLVVASTMALLIVQSTTALREETLEETVPEDVDDADRNVQQPFIPAPSQKSSLLCSILCRAKLRRGGVCLRTDDNNRSVTCGGGYVCTCG